MFITAVQLFPTKLAFILPCGTSANIAENVFGVSSGTIGELGIVWEHYPHGMEMKFAFLITSEEPALNTWHLRQWNRLDKTCFTYLSLRRGIGIYWR